MKTAGCFLMICLSGVLTNAGQVTSRPEQQVVTHVRSRHAQTRPADSARQIVRTFRFSADDLRNIVEQRRDLFQIPEPQRQELFRAADAVNFASLSRALAPYLAEHFAGRWDPQRDLVNIPVPPDKQVELPASLPDGKPLRGPLVETVGFLVHDLSDEEYASLATRVLQAARLLIDSGNPLHNRTSPEYYALLAREELRQAQEQVRQSQEDAKRREYIRRHIGELLGVYDRNTGRFDGQADWARETRRYTYLVRNGEFIDKIRPVVQRINDDLKIAGFTPPSPLDIPGINFEADLRDVEVVLPRPMLQEFLAEADRLERRMAEDHLISVEAVRLTDMDLLRGALGARLNASFQGIHNVEIDRNREQGLAEYGVNSLLAVANRQLQVSNLRGIEAGRLPAGSAPITLPTMELPLTLDNQRATTLGNSVSIGSDPRYFENGPIQRYGFSYIGPDGLEHTVSLDVADELTKLWTRIERNLVAHKIRKTEKTEQFTVPVGPKTAAFEGIAAIISQENEERVIVSENSLAKLEATGGSWLIIKDFEIEPVPGSAMVLTNEERRLARIRVLLTMLLRDPRVDVESKEKLVESATMDDLEQRLDDLYAARMQEPVLTVGKFRSYQDIYDERHAEVLADAEVVKKERNSRIRLCFYSSQGAINRLPTLDSLGDINDLTSFTTELQPNIVTPISTSITKTDDTAEGTSALTGIKRGQGELQEKQMTHLLLRVRYPSAFREKGDREEGRYTGYFELPLTRRPSSTVDVPFLSSSDHPLERLSRLRPGLMFASLQPERVRRPLELMTMEPMLGSVSQSAFNASMSRILLMQKLIADSPASTAAFAPPYKLRFIIEVRSLLEYDEDFFNVANAALRNTSHWNDPARIILALNHSNDRFALKRLIKMIDELGEKLLPDDYVRVNVARGLETVLGGHRVYPLGHEEIRILRRDVANHYMRFLEIYDDAFMEAVSLVMDLGSYRPAPGGDPRPGPFANYKELVVFDRGLAALAQPDLVEEAHREFLTLLEGGYRGKLFQKSFQYVEDMPKEHRRFVVRGHDILMKAEELSKTPGQWE